MASRAAMKKVVLINKEEIGRIEIGLKSWFFTL